MPDPSAPTPITFKIAIIETRNSVDLFEGRKGGGVQIIHRLHFTTSPKKTCPEIHFRRATCITHLYYLLSHGH